MGSKTTQETKIPPPTPEEMALMQMTTDALLPTYLAESGYDVTKKEVTWDQTDEAKRFADQRAQINQQIATLSSQTGQPSGGKGIGRGGGGLINERNVAFGQIDQLRKELADVDRRENDARNNYKPKIEYVTRKKADPETEIIRERYGENSPQYKEAYARYQEKEIVTSKQKASIDSLIVERTEKFLKGDFALNEGQKQFMNEMLGPLKDAGLNAVRLIRSEAGESEAKIGKAINDFGTQVKETGMNMDTALLTLEDRVRQTGTSMKDALKEEVGLTKELIKMGIQDFTQEERKRISSQAALLGRSSNDPEFQMELQNLATREIERSGLELGRYSAGQRLAIEERTGGGLEEAQRLRLGIQERTGAGLEEAARSRIGLAERTAGLREGASQFEGQLGLGMAETEANLRSQLSMGLPPQQVGLGINTSQYQQAIAQQRLANAAAAMNAPLNIYNTMAQERFAQPTTTTKKSGGLGSFFGGLLGIGLSGLGAAGGLGWQPFGRSSGGAAGYSAGRAAGG